MSYSMKLSIAEEDNILPLDPSASQTSVSRLLEFLDEALRDKPCLRVLDAGCGSATVISFPAKQVHRTGIDISQKQLERNHGLDVKIRADIQSYVYQPMSYDVIVCAWVLEHLPRPELALRGFALALDKGGLLVLAVPNVLSVKGLLTKYTPFALHVWAYRHLHGRQTTGRDDEGPFPSYLRYSLRPNAIRRFAESVGLQVVYFGACDILGEPWSFAGGNSGRVARKVYRGLKDLAKVATLGLLGESDVLIVLKKQS